MIGNSYHGTNFPHELLLTNTQVANFCKAFANNSSTDTDSWFTMLAELGFPVNSLFSMDSRPKNIAEQHDIV